MPARATRCRGTWRQVLVEVVAFSSAASVPPRQRRISCRQVPGDAPAAVRQVRAQTAPPRWYSAAALELLRTSGAEILLTREPRASSAAAKYHPARGTQDWHSAADVRATDLVRRLPLVLSGSSVRTFGPAGRWYSAAATVVSRTSPVSSVLGRSRTQARAAAARSALPPPEGRQRLRSRASGPCSAPLPRSTIPLDRVRWGGTRRQSAPETTVAQRFRLYQSTRWARWASSRWY